MILKQNLKGSIIFVWNVGNSIYKNISRQKKLNFSQKNY